MNTDIKRWNSMLMTAGNMLIKNEEELNSIDAAIGDGDHGITMTKIAEQMILCANKEFASTDELFDDLSMGILSTPGGSACSLYGTFFSGFAVSGRDNETDASAMKAMCINGYKELCDISNAKVGEKTMMDALIPAIETLKETDASPAVLFRKAAESAKKGAEATKNFTARFGRAKNYKERTLGFPDPGALSMSIIFDGFAKALESETK